MAQLFNDQLLQTLETLVRQHHTIYPRLPPQGLFFESLVERAFHLCGAPDAQIVQTSPNAPQHDLLVAGTKISLKTETGKGTSPTLIAITKLCTTEKEPWTAQVLVHRVMQHLSRYERMLMLRAVWPGKQNFIHYQLVEIPADLLRLIGSVTLVPVGRRTGRQSLAGDVQYQGAVAFRVHFDGADGKCQVRNLPVSLCQMLREWDQRT